VGSGAPRSPWALDRLRTTQENPNAKEEIQDDGRRQRTTAGETRTWTELRASRQRSANKIEQREAGRASGGGSSEREDSNGENRPDGEDQGDASGPDGSSGEGISEEGDGESGEVRDPERDDKNGGNDDDNGGGSEKDLSSPALRVAACESGNRLADGSAEIGTHDYKAENPVSSASGAYQFIDSTWKSVTGLAPPASAHSPDVQDRAFEDLWDGGSGAYHWNASRSCWDR